MSAGRITPAEIATARALASETWQPMRELLERHKNNIDTPAAKAKRERRRQELREHGRPCYVRFGDPPPDGISRNHLNGRPEGGLSVFPAFEMGGRYIIDPGEDGDLVMSLLICMVAHPGPTYLVRGIVVGTGGATEPVLKDFALEPIPREAVESLWEFHWSVKVGAWLGLAGTALFGSGA
jgi:hypothetical protein